MKYSGMTVNERLWVSGLSDQFYSAVENKNVSRIVEILKKVELNDETIKADLEFFGFDPELYEPDEKTR
jgi:hypothetical protein